MLGETFTGKEIHFVPKVDKSLVAEDKVYKRMMEMRLNSLFFNENYIGDREQLLVEDIKLFKILEKNSAD